MFPVNAFRKPKRKAGISCLNPHHPRARVSRLPLARRPPIKILECDTNRYQYLLASRPGRSSPRGIPLRLVSNVPVRRTAYQAQSSPPRQPFVTTRYVEVDVSKK